MPTFLKKIAQHYDFQKKFEIRNVLMHLVAGDVGSAVEGEFWYDTSGHKPRYAGSGGTPADFTGSPTGAAGGDLTGTYPNPTIGSGKVTLAQLANLAANSIMGNNTGSSATPLALTASQVKTLLAIVAANISDFDAQVRTSRLDQMATPTADVSHGSHKITSLLTGTADTDAANVGQVNALLQGLTNKASVRAASTANGTLSSAFANGQVLDGVTLATGDRILLAGQTDATADGIYLVNASGAPTRATDADISAEVKAGLYVFVSEGTVNGNKGFQLFTDDPITLGSTSLNFQIVSAAGQITAGAGLTKTGDTIDVIGGTGITVAADLVSADTTLMARYKTFTVGDSAASTFALTHSLGRKIVSVTVSDTTDDSEWDVGVVFTSTSVVTIDFGTVVPTASQFSVLVIG